MTEGMQVGLSDVNIPLLEFDSDTVALVDPWRNQTTAEAPTAAVACFFPEIVERLSSHGKAILDLPTGDPLWEIQYRGQRLAVFYPGVGAPLASYSLEKVIAAGSKTIVGCGGAGAVRSELAMGHHIIIVDSAVRDEGTSYHYLPPAREVQVDPMIVKALARIADCRDLPHIVGKTWTTDGLFRETMSRVARRRSEGCITVEMEASALLAVASFRKVQFGQYLYAGDDLSGEIWDDRDWRQATDIRHMLVELASDAALMLDGKLNL